MAKYRIKLGENSTDLEIPFAFNIEALECKVTFTFYNYETRTDEEKAEIARFALFVRSNINTTGECAIQFYREHDETYINVFSWYNNTKDVFEIVNSWDPKREELGSVWAIETVIYELIGNESES